MAQQIVHNTGTNFTLYYNVLNYFKTIMSNHPSISAVTQGDITSIDVDQFPNYPLGNILITDTSFGTSVTTYQIQLTVADKIKNKNNESDDRKIKALILATKRIDAQLINGFKATLGQTLQFPRAFVNDGIYNIIPSVFDLSGICCQ
jgi:hypothetical protein